MKLISVNIETDNHLQNIFRFVRNEKPDVLCLQEVFECDLAVIERETGLQTAVYSSTMQVEHELREHRIKPKGNIGVAILSAYVPKKYAEVEYGIPPGSEGAVPVWDGDVRDGNISRKVLISAVFDINECEYQIFTTHFAWSAGGQTTDIQREHMKKLLNILTEKSEFVLCGDFNAPRGREVWQMLAGRYKDNIPENVTTTIDSARHKIATEGKSITLVVDGMFSTPQYKVSNVRVMDGVSDHMAIVAEVEKVASV